MSRSDAIDQPPASLGYRMPAEWERHAATWLAWPHNRSDWPGKFAPIPWVYAEIVRNLARGERVEILVQDAAEEQSARRVLDKANALGVYVRFRRCQTNRVWTRDYGPQFLVGRQHNGALRQTALGAANFRFNAWAKYPDWRLDDAAGRKIARWSGALEFRSSLVLEGGSIDVNGAGLLLTTEECLLSDVQQRNPQCGREEIGRALADFLGIESVLWLGRGIVGDDTHGHVDDIARFVARDTVVAAVEADRSDANHDPLAENLVRLRARKLNVIELPMPRPVVFAGRRLPASYANFYIANACVLVPVFNDRADRLALNAIAECFPDREVVPIYCGDLVWGLGTIHCMTQQQPEATK